MALPISPTLDILHLNTKLLELDLLLTECKCYHYRLTDRFILVSLILIIVATAGIEPGTFWTIYWCTTHETTGRTKNGCCCCKFTYVATNIKQKNVSILCVSIMSVT
jgi:hypothetical protein